MTCKQPRSRHFSRLSSTSVRRIAGGLSLTTKLPDHVVPRNRRVTPRIPRVGSIRRPLFSKRADPMYQCPLPSRISTHTTSTPSIDSQTSKDKTQKDLKRCPVTCSLPKCLTGDVSLGPNTPPNSSDLDLPFPASQPVDKLARPRLPSPHQTSLERPGRPSSNPEPTKAYQGLLPLPRQPSDERGE